MPDITDFEDEEVEKYILDDEDVYGAEDLSDDEVDVESENGDTSEKSESDSQPTRRLTKMQEEATVGAVVDLVGGMIAMMKHYKGEAREEFMKQYHSITDPLLTLIGFGNALASMPVSSMSPKTTMMIGFGLMVVVGLFFVRVEKKNENSEEANFDFTKIADMNSTVAKNDEKDTEEVVDKDAEGGVEP